MALAAPAPDDHVVLLARERATAARSRPRRKPRRSRAKSAPARSARRAPAPAASPARPLVLIVEDHVDTRLMYAEYLRFTGLTVTEARDALTGVAKAIALRPNVIVMDLMLPGVDGWEAIRRLRMNALTARLPIIVITGHEHKDYLRHAAIAAGADAYLIKPCLPSRLGSEIQRVLRTNPI
jgi:two-component system cell cycle response regulator DivK